MVTLQGTLLAALWGYLEPAIFFFGGDKWSPTARGILGVFFYLLVIALPPVILYFSYPRFANSNFQKKIRGLSGTYITKSKTTLGSASSSISRAEVDGAERELSQGKPIVITGEGGSGKTGIGIQLASRRNVESFESLILDSRLVQEIGDITSLSRFFLVNDSLSELFADQAKCRPFRLIIDQLDNVTELPIAGLLIDLAIECSQLSSIEVVVISRNRERYETELLKRLTDAHFVEIPCLSLDTSIVTRHLESIGLPSPPDRIVNLGKNLLNLEIITSLKEKNATLSFAVIDDEVALWDAYFETLRDRIANGYSYKQADHFIRRAKEYAAEALKSNAYEIDVQGVPDRVTSLLESNGIIDLVASGKYRFRHEKVQDYLYAKYAIEDNLQVSEILTDIGPIRSVNAITWLIRMQIKAPTMNLADFSEGILYG